MTNKKTEDGTDIADTEWQEDKKRLFRQIIGAVVLFIVAVFLWTLSAPPSSDIESPSLTGTDSDIPVETRDIGTVVESLVEVQQADNLTADEQEIATDSEIETSVDDSAGVTSTPTASAVKVDATVAVAEKAEKAALTQQTATLTPPAANALSLRVGVFSKADNVKRLNKKLKDMDFSTATEKNQKGTVLYIIGLADVAAKLQAKKQVVALLDKPLKIPKPIPPTANALSLRVGVFSKADNVKRLNKKLKDMDFSTATEKNQKGTALYIIGLADVAAKLQAKKQVVALLDKPLKIPKPIPPTAPKDNSPAVNTEDKVVIQVAALSKQSRVEMVTAQLRKSGFNTAIVPIKRNSLSLFRVLVLLDKGGDVTATKQQLSKLGYDKAYVVNKDL